MASKTRIGDDVLELVNKYQRYGDLSAISKKFYGNNLGRANVKWVLLTRCGDPELIKIIEQFYRERERALESLNDYEA